MPQSQDRAARRRRQARLMKTVNVIMRPVLSAPIPTPLGGRLMLIYLTGRKTGRRYRVPVSYVRDGSALLTPGGGRWTANLTSGASVRLRINGRDVTAMPEVLAGAAEVASLLAVLTAANPGAARYIPIGREADGAFKRDDVAAAVRHGFRMIRWHLPEPVRSPAAAAGQDARPAS